MHAASVHPEPGSNSRANCIWTVTGLNLVCRACLALYTLLSMSRIRDRFEILFSKKFRDSFASSFCLYFNLLLFNCQWSARIPPLFQCRVFRDLIIIPHLFPFVKRFLKSFSKIFAVFFRFSSLPHLGSLVVSLHIIALLFLFVKRFLTTFFSLETIAVCHKNVVAKLCKKHTNSRIQP